MNPHVTEVENVAGRAAAVIAGGIQDAIDARGRCLLAVSRPTPTEAFESLAEAGVDWPRVELFQVDERAAPAGSQDRNLTLIEDVFGSTGVMIHPMPVDEPDLDAGARTYEGELRSFGGDPPVLDVVHLGLGPDGHTASLLPGDPVLRERDRFVATTKEANGFRRVTFTYAALNAARRVIFLVTGLEKAPALARVLAHDAEMPAARLTARDVAIIGDPEAFSASDLHK